MRTKLFAVLLSLFAAAAMLSLISTAAATPGGPTASCEVPSAAHANIQHAVDDAACAVVHIAAGTFYENIAIARAVTLQGQGAGSTIVDGLASGSVISINVSAPVTVSGLMITNGWAEQGGGIYVREAALLITNSTVSGNSAKWNGGGISSMDADLYVINSLIDSNVAGGSGGGIHAGGRALTVTSSVISGNSAEYGGGLHLAGTALLDQTAVRENHVTIDGGGIFNGGSTTIRRSGINNNQSTHYSGGGIYDQGGSMYINNSTISGNEAVVDAAGIHSTHGAIRLNSSTVANNSGGVTAGVSEDNSNIRLKNSLIQNNNSSGGYGDCRGTLYSDGYNLIGDTSSCGFISSTGDRLNVAARLGELAGQPGFLPLLIGPGVNGANPDGCLDSLGQLLTADQRGMPRVGVCDIGAVEFQGAFHQTYLPISANNFCADALDDFFDDFSHPGSGWPEEEDAFVLSGYVHGEFRVLTKQSGYFYLYRAPTCSRQDYMIEVDARWVGAPGSSYGLLFGMSGDYSQYYLFEINTDYQMYRLLRRDPDGFTVLVPITSGAGISWGTAVNRLKVTRSGSWIELRVNDQYLTELHDTSFSGLTNVGIVSSPYNDMPVSDARFDNFRVTRIANSAAANTGPLPAAAPAAAPGDWGNSSRAVRFSLEDLPPWPEIQHTGGSPARQH